MGVKLKMCKFRKQKGLNSTLKKKLKRSPLGNMRNQYYPELMSPKYYYNI